MKKKTFSNYSEFKEEDELIVVESDPEAAPIAHATFIRSKKGRALQMNKGVTHSTGDVLYIVHADTWPPKGFRKDIETSTDSGHPYGCYPFQFDSKKWYLKVNAFTTQFDFLYFRGGDQSLFVTRKFFEKIKGFDEYYTVMEEYDFFRRARRHAPIHFMKHQRIKVSARKYDDNPYWRVNWANFIAVRMFKKGKSPDEIKQKYASILTQIVNRN